MKIGIYEKAINNKFSWEEKILIAKEAGYDFIEFSIDESEARLARLDWDNKEINQLRALLAKHNFSFNSMTLSGHRKYPFGSRDPEIRKRAYEIIEKAVQLSLKLGIKNIQLAGYDVYYEKSSKETEAHFFKGIKYAVRLAMENSIMMSFEIMDTPFMGTMTKALKWVKKVNSPWLKIYPDTGNLFHWVQNDFAKEIMLGKDYIIAAHFKDTKPGIFKNIPFGEGTVDFKIVFEAFASINFRGPWLIEMWSKSKDNETKEENVKYIKDALEFFNEQRKGIL